MSCCLSFWQTKVNCLMPPVQWQIVLQWLSAVTEASGKSEIENLKPLNRCFVFRTEIRIYSLRNQMIIWKHHAPSSSCAPNLETFNLLLSFLKRVSETFKLKVCAYFAPIHSPLKYPIQIVELENYPFLPFNS